MKFLKNINSPEDLKKQSFKDLPEICDELREFIIEELSNNPGHFASSLGTVELTVALHYVFNTPYDKLVWDVGHQAYSHKILTGRRDKFNTNRKLNGLSGFTNPNESKYDSFIAGHASTSISAALGMAVAAELKNELNKQIVAIIGDGSMTGGLAYEGLNNVCSQPNNLLIILNDNNMSIDNNVGALKDYLIKLNTSSKYNNFRNKIYNFLKKIRLINKKRENLILRFNNSIKSFIIREQNIFEGFNIRYFGPVDGHDVKNLIRIFTNIKNIQGPKILHIKTIKGKGFTPAEENAIKWHAPGKFDKNSGEIIKKTDNNIPLYQDVFGKTLVDLAKKEEKIVAITPAMPTGCSMIEMMKEFPKRSFDVGIAEAHAVTYSAGLAKEGLIPFCNIYSSFMQRAYDQIIHDVALQNLKVIMCLDRSGIVGEDGPTHHGVFDLSYLKPIPNIIISAPYDGQELVNLMYTSVYNNNSPFVIRYPRGNCKRINWNEKPEILSIGKGRKLKNGNDIAIISIGDIGNNVSEAIKMSDDNISIAHYDLVFLKPLDKKLLYEIGKQFKYIITVEDGALEGGMGSTIIDFFSENGFIDMKIYRLGIEDKFVTHGTIDELKEIVKIDTNSILKKIYSVNEYRKNAI